MKVWQFLKAEMYFGFVAVPNHYTLKINKKLGERMLKITLKKMFSLLFILLLISCSKRTNTIDFPKLVNSDGSYLVSPLEKDEVVLKIIQSSVQDVTDIENAEEIINSNLSNVKKMIEQACTEDDKPDIVLLHEFPLTGYIYGNRNDKIDMALTIPGPESNVLCDIANDNDIYLIFGSYVNDSDWPGHILSLTTVINKDGQIVKKIWKPRNIKRFYSSFEITTTTVESIREKFRKRYGVEEEFPILRTEFGNIALSTAQLDPFIFAAFAMQGAEIILRTSTLFFESDVIYTAMVNNVYSAMSNIPNSSKYGGNSMVVSPLGDVIARLDNSTEGILTAHIPIAKFRENRKLPQYSVELTKSIIDQYVEEIPVNHLDLPAEKLPIDGKEMKNLLDRISRWSSER